MHHCTFGALSSSSSVHSVGSAGACIDVAFEDTVGHVDEVVVDHDVSHAANVMSVDHNTGVVTFLTVYAENKIEKRSFHLFLNTYSIVENG